MQVADSANLRRNWGTKGCSHRHVEKEFFAGTATGQYACTVCGKTFVHGNESRQARVPSPGH